MDSNKKIEELEKRVAALEKPISFSPEYIQALLNTGFTIFFGVSEECVDNA